VETVKTGLEQPEMSLRVSDLTPNSHRARSSHHPAFLFYYPQNGKPRGRVFYNEEAWRILSMKVPPLRKNGGSSLDICSLCSKWKGLLDKAINQRAGSDEKEAAAPSSIETIQSYRRQYVVKGIVLLDDLSNTEKKERSYLFVLERMEQDSMHLSQAARHLNLNRREQEIVRLLVGGLGNKEIAFALGLSLNTIKGYMKLLMGKLKVRSRTEIISILLTGAPDFTKPFHQFPPSPQMTSPSLKLT